MLHDSCRAQLGYGGYDFLDQQPGVVHAACWAHARRKFVEAEQAAAPPKGAGSSKEGRAAQALGFIRRLDALEQSAEGRGLVGEDRRAERQAKARPILDAFKEWLDQQAITVPPKSLLGKAIHYTLGQWPRLVVYCDDPNLTLDNNLVENAIRPFCVGRKNWLFSATPRGAAASALLYSLIETAKANGREPYAYLRYIFERLPLARTAEDYQALLPHALTAQDLAVPSPVGTGGR